MLRLEDATLRLIFDNLLDKDLYEPSLLSRRVFGLALVALLGRRGIHPGDQDIRVELHDTRRPVDAITVLHVLPETWNIQNLLCEFHHNINQNALFNDVDRLSRLCSKFSSIQSV